MNPAKLLVRITTSPQNVRFRDARRLVEALGFRLDRIEGSHHIFVHSQVPQPLNLQEVRGEAKAYQLRQLLRAVERYNLKLGGE